VGPPSDEEAFLVSAKQLRSDPALRREAGGRARAYAEMTFDTTVIADRFQDVIDRAVDRRAVSRGEEI
jgi:hypothetical protein